MAVKPGVDWVVPYYRDISLSLVMGMTLEELMMGFFSRAADPSTGGRLMLGHYGKAALQYVTGSSCVASQILHAVGIGMALKMRGEAACLTCFGEGATAEGDFHEAMSFAGIHQLPVVFFCQNNGYSITVPTDEEIPVGVAERARGYGFPGVRVDGNDPVAVHRVMTEAVARARAGQGPSLIEAIVYRLTPHSSDDDDRRYRTAEEVEEHRRTEPVAAFRARLQAAGLLDDALDAEIIAEVNDELEAAQAAAEAAPDPDPATLTDHVLSTDPQDLSDAAPDEPGLPEGEPQKTILEAVREAMADEMERDERVFVIGEDVGAGGVFRATEGLRDRFGEVAQLQHPDRRVADRGQRHRRGLRRAPPDRRDAVRRLQPPGLQPDRQRGRSAPATGRWATSPARSSSVRRSAAASTAPSTTPSRRRPCTATRRGSRSSPRATRTTPRAC